jgi:hypothetical protein
MLLSQGIMPIFFAPIPQHPHKTVSPFPRCLLLYHPVALEAFAPIKGKPEKIEGSLRFSALWWFPEWYQSGLFRMKV